RRRTRLCRLARLRSGVRQPRSDRCLRRRRRRSGNWTAGDELAFQQIPQSGEGRGGFPILHLNGYKIANPCILPRFPHEELDHLFRGYGYTPYFVEGREPEKMHELMAETLDTVIAEIQRIKADARRNGFTERPRWPMIVLRTPKGWTCPKEIDGKRTEDYWRSHQVRRGEMKETPARVPILKEWMKRNKPAALFDGSGRLRPELPAPPPRGTRRMSANPHTNGGLLLRELRLPNFRDYAVEV